MQILEGIYGTPRWSPDNSVMVVYHETDSGVVPAIVRADGSDYRELTLPDGLSCGEGVWRPDGGALALECWDESDAARVGIWLAKPAGAGEMHQITTGHGIPGEFSRDGQRLLFGLDRDGSTLDLAIVNVDGSDERTLTTGIRQMPGFLDGGDSIYAVVDGSIVIFDTRGKRLRTIRAPEPKIVEARVSPEEQFWAFIYDPQAAVAPGLYLMAFDGSGIAPIVHTNAAGTQEEHPDWMH